MDLDRYPATGPAQAIATGTTFHPNHPDEHIVRIVQYEPAVYPTKFSRTAPPVDMPGPSLGALDTLDLASAQGKRIRHIGPTVYVIW